MNTDNLGQFLTNLMSMNPKQKSEVMDRLISSLKSNGFLDDNGPEEVY